MIRWIVVALTLLPSVAAADSWAPRSYLLRHSVDDRHFVLALYGDYVLAERAEGAGRWQPGSATEVTARSRRGRRPAPTIEPTDTVLARGSLARDPLEAYVLRGGAGVVFFDTFGGMGYGSVLTVVDGSGAVKVDLELDDLFEPHVVASFSRTTSSIHWAKDWWVDEDAGVIGLQYGGNVLTWVPGTAPRTEGWMAVDLWTGAPREVDDALLRARALQAPPRKAGPLFDALAPTAPEAWLTDVLGDMAAPWVLRLAAEGELRARGRDGIGLIEATLANTAPGGTHDPEATPGARRAERADREARWSERREAIRQLGLARGEAALPELIARADGREEHAALEGIRRVGRRAPSALARLAADTTRSGPVRGAAALGVGDSGERGHAEGLLALVAGTGEPYRTILQGVCELPDAPALLRTWIGDDPDRADQVVEATAPSRTPHMLPLLEDLARAELASNALLARALAQRGGPGIDVVASLLRDDAVSEAAYLKVLAANPRPDLRPVLLAVLDRLPAGPVDESMSRALRRSGVPEDELVSRLRAGHPADATLADALAPSRKSSDAVRDALAAGLKRHAGPNDPAFDALLWGAVRSRALGANGALEGVLRRTTDPRVVDRIAPLFEEAPAPSQVKPLLGALERFHGERYACKRVAQALAEHEVGDHLRRIERVARKSAGAAGCVGAFAKKNGTPELVPALVDAMTRHPMGEELYDVIDALAKAQDPRAVPGLVAGLHAEHNGPVRDAAEGLARLGEPGLDALVAALRDGSPNDFAVISALRGHKGPLPGGLIEAIDAMLARLEGSDHPDATRLANAAEALVRRLNGG